MRRTSIVAKKIASIAERIAKIIRSADQFTLLN